VVSQPDSSVVAASRPTQTAVIEFLSDPATHRAPVRLIETPGSLVFLAGEEAYKLKRAVTFSFMDFSTLDRRRAACEAEVAINRRNAPALYLGTLPVTRGPAGLALGGPGEILDWVVHMRRFDESLTLDRIADKGGLTAPLVDAILKVVFASHERAERRDGAIALAALVTCLAQNGEAFARSAALFPAEDAKQLLRQSRAELGRLRSLLLSRATEGCVRRCHGDLHLRNIALIADKPTLFDAIEFDEAVATTDVLYDLAFLLMDLWQRGLQSAANRLLNGYLDAAGDRDLDALAALPLFMSIRAQIRAKVTAAAVPHSGDAAPAVTLLAQSYFHLATALLNPAPPRILAIGGLSGTGKTTLGRRIAPRLGRPPGAVHLRSDIVRKRLWQVPPTTRLPPSAYGAASSSEVYEQLRRDAAVVIRGGQSVIVDAVHARPEERRETAAIASGYGVRFDGIWLDAALGQMEARVERRTGDASDATPEVVAAQSGYDLGVIDWHRVDAGQPVDDVDRAASAALDLPPTPDEVSDPRRAGEGHQLPMSHPRP